MVSTRRGPRFPILGLAYNLLDQSLEIIQLNYQELNEAAPASTTSEGMSKADP